MMQAAKQTIKTDTGSAVHHCYIACAICGHTNITFHQWLLLDSLAEIVLELSYTTKLPHAHHEYPRVCHRSPALYHRTTYYTMDPLTTPQVQHYTTGPPHYPTGPPTPPHRSPHTTPQVPTPPHRSPHTTPQVPTPLHRYPPHSTGPHTTPQVPTLPHRYPHTTPQVPTLPHIYITISILHTTLSHLGTAPIRTSSVFFALLPIIACFKDRTAFNRVSISEESRHKRKDWKIS